MINGKMNSLILCLLGIKPQSKESLKKTIEKNYMVFIRPDRLSSIESVLKDNLDSYKIGISGNQYLLTSLGKNFIYKTDYDFKKLAIYHYIFCNPEIKLIALEKNMKWWIEKDKSTSWALNEEIEYLYSDKIEMEGDGYELTDEGKKDYRKLLFD